jgi:glycosyltransferase involved in cell wall biosynthesis
MLRKLAIITTHPIQYYAPVFRLLSEKITLKVFYTKGLITQQYDYGFQKNITWDIPLTDGYEFDFLENIAATKGGHRFKHIVNPNAISKIKGFQPDAILVYGWAYQSHLKIIRYFKGKIPVYFRGDSTLLDQTFNPKTLLRTLLLTWVYKHIDIAFYVGTANKEYFKKHGLNENQLIFAPHATDNGRFSEDRSIEANLLRDKLKINSTDILILFAGKLERKKNPELIMNAFLALRDQNVHLLFVGSGIQEESLKTKSSNIKNIHFLPFQNQSQMPVIYQACDLFCLPSQGPGETWGLAVNEAMAASNAILVSDKVGCNLDLVTKENGAVFKSGDLTDLTQKLITLTKDKATIKKMGENSLKHIQNWSFEQQVKAIASYVNR